MEKPSREGRMKRWAALTLVGVAIIGLLAWTASNLWRWDDRKTAGVGRNDASPAVSAASPDAKRFRPVEISPALVSEYYEHGPEHTPPRDPSGAMQRRERDYTPPPNPFPILRQKLGNSGPDAQVRSWLDAYESKLMGKAHAVEDDESARPVDSIGRRGRILPSRTDSALGQMLSQCSLDAETLLDVGRSFQFLDGEALAATWYLAGFVKAETQFKDTPPGDPSARRVLALAEQTGKALWRANIWDVQEKRFRLARRLYPPLSVEARRNGVLLGVSLFYQGKANEAADVILQVQAEHDKAGDLGVRERSDLDEMAWLQGLFLSQAGRNAEALPHFKRCAELGMHWSSQARLMVEHLEAEMARRGPTPAAERPVPAQ